MIYLVQNNNFIKMVSPKKCHFSKNNFSEEIIEFLRKQFIIRIVSTMFQNS